MQDLGHVPVSMLSLLNRWLGCVLAVPACCSLVCWAGSKCAMLTVPPGTMVLADGTTPLADALRAVLITSTPRPTAMHIFTLSVKAGTIAVKPLHVFVTDSPTAARQCPMELTALRAAVQHRSYRHLHVRWTCPMAPAKARRGQVEDSEVPDLVAAAFRDARAAAEWAVLAAELDDLYNCRSPNAAAAARKVSDLMAKMAELLPFAYSKAVRRLLQQPLVKVSLDTPGFFVYCLVSPFLGRLYVGATGFLEPRAPYLRLREHLRSARLWSSRSSVRRYKGRIPEYYAAFKKVGIGNIVQVIIAVATEHTRGSRALLHPTVVAGVQREERPGGQRRRRPTSRDTSARSGSFW